MNEVLRNALSAKGMTAETLAVRLGIDAKTVRRWDSEGRIPQARHRAAAAEALGRDVEELWPESVRRRDVAWFRPWREQESASVSLRGFEIGVVPGLLQTEDYARAVLSSSPLHLEEVERLVRIRLERQKAVFDRPRPPMCVFVVDQAVLMRGHPELMAAQLAQLISMAERPNVFVHVIPLEAGLHPGQAGFVLASMHDSPDVAWLDDQASGRLVSDPNQLASLTRVWDAVRGYALPRDLSIQLLKARPWLT